VSGSTPIAEAVLPARPRLRGVLHQAAFFAACGAGAALVAVVDGRRLVAATVFAASAATMLGASALYHRVPWGARARLWMRRADHAGIYLLIAGTYTPFTLVSLRGAWGWTLFGLVWTIALLGVGWKIVGVERHEVVSTILYIAMGWLIVIAVRPLFRAIPMGGLAWLLAGGLAYTVGVAFFGASRLRFNHAVWHLFVLAGSTCHYVAVMLYVLPHGNV
jgi:hemolysin III